MKTSNKIIAVIFGILILIPALVVATILIKYRNGDFTRIEAKSTLISQEFPGILNITLRGLEDLTIVPSDTLYAEIVPVSERAVKFEKQGDSLLIFGDTSYIRHDTAKNNTVTQEEVNIRSDHRVKLYLPASYSLTLNNCNVQFAAEGREKTVEHYNLHFKNSNLDFSTEDSTRLTFRKLTVSGEESDIKFNNHWHIQELDLNLNKKSHLFAFDSQIDRIYVAADSSSAVQFNGRQLKSIIQKQ
jgi:hypothetical protein